MTAVWFQFCGNHIGKYSWSQSCSIRIHKKEQWMFTKQLRAQFDQRMNCLFNLPDFSFWSSPVRRRIHNDSIVMVAPADFPLYKFYAVIYNPANRSIFQPGRSCIFLCPCHHTFGGVHMSDGSSGSSSSQCSTAGICKKIQHFDRTTGIFDFFSEPIPVGSLFREKTGVLKTKRLQVECQIIVMNGPLLRKIKKFPFAAAFFTAMIVSVHFVPSGMFSWGIPDYLRIRANQNIFSPSFQLFSI